METEEKAPQMNEVGALALHSAAVRRGLGAARQARRVWKSRTWRQGQLSPRVPSLKRKKKNQRSLGSGTRPRPPRWPATWARRLRRCPLPPAAGPGLRFHLLRWFQFQAEERRDGLSWDDRPGGQDRCGAPRARPPSGPRLAQLFAPPPSAQRLGGQGQDARSGAEWESRLT